MKNSWKDKQCNSHSQDNTWSYHTSTRDTHIIVHPNLKALLGGETLKIEPRACCFKSALCHSTLIKASCLTRDEQKLNYRLWPSLKAPLMPKSSWFILQICVLNEFTQINRWPDQSGISQQHVFVWITWSQTFHSWSKIKLWLLDVTWGNSGESTQMSNLWFSFISKFYIIFTVIYKKNLKHVYVLSTCVWWWGIVHKDPNSVILSTAKQTDSCMGLCFIRWNIYFTAILSLKFYFPT